MPKEYSFEILIKSFLRFKKLAKLIDSISQLYPTCVVRIADDSGDSEERDAFIAALRPEIRINFYKLPFNRGISAGRNFLLRTVEKPYFVILDDDTRFFDKTCLEKLENVLSADSCGIIAGGDYLNFGTTPKGFYGDIKVTKSYFQVRRYGECAPRKLVEGIETIPCRFTDNFFMGKTALFRKYDSYWDERLKINENVPFFLRIPRKLNLYFVPSVQVLHYPGTDNNEADESRKYFSYRFNPAELVRAERVLGLKRKSSVAIHVSRKFIFRKGVRFSSDVMSGFFLWIKRKLGILKISFWVEKVRGLRQIVFQDIPLLLRLFESRKKKKILYLLTPPPALRNIGDHAQVIAIRRWLHKHYGDLRVFEFDKVQSYRCLRFLKFFCLKGDVIFLHSGGNMGDRGMWSETIRRRIILSFPKNKIISLPQTIFFSGTEQGVREYQETCRSYSGHPDLTVIAREPFSKTLAKNMFPGCKILCFPDFALSLRGLPSAEEVLSDKILLCLREDNESRLRQSDKERIISLLNKPFELKDITVTAGPISKCRQQTLVDETIRRFASYRLIVTDRLHGVIFSFLAKRPCIALASIDHKITSSMFWFEKIPWILYAGNIADLPILVNQLLHAKTHGGVDWNAQYFDEMPKYFQLARLMKNER